MAQRKLQVFVSSTYTDLRDERQAAVTAILRQGHIPAGMELFAAGDEEQLQVIRRWIEESDVFMLILGARYGSVNPSGTKSYIHLEYEYALELGKPLFAVILSPEYSLEKVRNGSRRKDIVEQTNKAAFQEFERLVRSRLCARAENLTDIHAAVASSLQDIERRHQLTGWAPSRQSAASMYANRAEPDYTTTLLRELDIACQIDAIGLGNNALTQERSIEFYRSFVQRGGRLRALFLAPNGSAIRERERAEQREPGSLSYTVVHNVEDMRRFISRTQLPSESTKDAFEVRFYDASPTLNMIMIDRRVAFVHYYGSRDRGQDAPCFVTYDPKVVQYFEDEFEFLWSNGNKGA